MITFIYGDSITTGLWSSDGGWADRIKSYILADSVRKKLTSYNYAYNLGVDGNTSAQLLQRFFAETDARLWPNAENSFIFAIGTNDTSVIDGETVCSTKEFLENITELYKYANKLTQKIMFIDLLPVNEVLTNPLPSSTKGRSYRNDVIDKYNTVLHLFCSKNNIDCVYANELFRNSNKGNYESLLLDGLHPNNEGHNLIYDAVLPTVKVWLG